MNDDQCPKCGIDTGLLAEELLEERFPCPACGAKLTAHYGIGLVPGSSDPLEFYWLDPVST